MLADSNSIGTTAPVCHVSARLRESASTNRSQSRRGFVRTGMGIGVLSLLRSPEITAPAAAATAATVTMMVINT